MTSITSMFEKAIENAQESVRAQEELTNELAKVRALAEKLAKELTTETARAEHAEQELAKKTTMLEEAENHIRMLCEVSGCSIIGTRSW